MKRVGVALITIVLAGGVAADLSAHPGGLNSAGCHTNRKMGDYHCHGAPSSPRTDRQPQSAYNAPAPSRSNGSGVFRNCAEARAAGAAPVRRGSAGYGPHLDRDGDGIGCEPYRGRG